MNIQGIIFDLDGTLLYTLDTLAKSYNTALSRLGFPVHPAESYKQFVGDGARRCVERCLPSGSFDAETVDRCLSIQRHIYSRTWSDGTIPYEGIPALLDQLANHNIKLGVLSNKDDAFTQRCVNHFFPDKRFEAIQGHSGQIPLKPDPGGAMAIADRMQLSPQQLMMVGDSKMDIQTAQACNMVAVGVSWGFRQVAELKQAGAGFILDSPSALLDILELFGTIKK